MQSSEGFLHWRSLAFLTLFLLLPIGIFFYHGISNQTSNIQDWTKEADITLSQVAENLKLLSDTTSSKQLQEELWDILKQLEEVRSDISDDTLSYNSHAESSDIDVCPEEYYVDVLTGNPAAFSQGFKEISCIGVPSFSSIITAVFNLVQTRNPGSLVEDLVSELKRTHAGIRVILGLPNNSSDRFRLMTGADVFFFDESITAGSDIWRYLLAEVKTKYVYVGRHVVKFTEDTQLHRLVREVGNLNVSFAAASTRTIDTGQWNMECQRVLRNGSSMLFMGGYDRCDDGCVYCDSLHTAPFVSKINIFQKTPLRTGMTETSGFAAWFSDILKASAIQGVVCPDSMAFISKASRTQQKADWADYACLKNVDQISFSDDNMMSWDSEEMKLICGGSYLQTEKHDGARTDSVNKVLDICEDGDMLCELAESTLLQAVKGSKIAAGEVDAFIRVHPDNYTSLLSTIRATLHSPEYIVMRHHGAAYILMANRLTIQVKQDPYVNMQQYSPSPLIPGLSATKVKMHGQYRSTPLNPGASLRNRYGNNVCHDSEEL